MAVIATGNHPKALWPGVYSWFGAKYDEHEKQYPKLFDIKSSSKNFEELVQHTGFGLAPHSIRFSPAGLYGKRH